ncbi:hypothetical protein [Methanobrevibacter sp.]|uniref:hypothetical protein n=1 Tax=Methanobrevibacter sp. TaxID=66852 RepID=UPI0038908605
MFLIDDFNKQDVKIEVLSDDNLNKGDTLIVQLSDLKNNPISNEKILIKFDSGNTYTITTDSQGKGYLALNDLSGGNYIANITFDGNKNYKSASITENIQINEVATSTSSPGNPIEDNRPTNDEDYKGYTPRHESEVTADGWNPNEHEVSREDLGDGRHRINYDDGYFVIADENGYIITYGF